MFSILTPRSSGMDAFIEMVMRRLYNYSDGSDCGSDVIYVFCSVIKMGVNLDLDFV